MSEMRNILVGAAGLLPLLAGLAGCTHQQAPVAAESCHYGLLCMEQDYPALLLKPVNNAGQAYTVRQDDAGDLDPVYQLTCVVLRSYKLEPKPGDMVLLMVPSGPSGNESGLAERTRYWFVSGEQGEDWIPQRKPGPSSSPCYTVNALNFHGFDAEWALLPAREQLHGVWREMADVVAEKR